MANETSSKPENPRPDILQAILGLKGHQLSLQNTSKVLRFIDKVQPLVRLVNRHGKSNGVVANVTSSVMSPIWSCLRVVVNVDTDTDEYFSCLTDTLDRISDMLPLCDIYASLFPRHELLREAICELYSTVETFVARASHVFGSSGRVLGKAVRIDFNAEFEPHLGAVRRWADQVERRVGIAHMAEQEASRRELSNAMVELSRVRTELAGLKELVRSGEKVPTLPEVAVWLNARQCHEEKSQVKNAAQACRWEAVFSDTAFPTWLQQDGKQILWAHGPPGCGKTFLYSALTEHIQDVAQKKLVYLFCEADRVRTTTISLFRSWTFQLVKLLWRSETSPEALNRVRCILMYRTTPEATDDEVMELLLTILQASDTPDFFLTADALDECTDADNFVTFLPQIPSRFKVLATSQNPPPDSKSVVPLPITPSLTQTEITRHLSTALPLLRDPSNPAHSLPSTILTQIHTTLSSESNLLFTRLTLENLSHQTTLPGILSSLAGIPQSLAHRYDRIMSSVQSTQPPPHVQLARRVIFWVLAARVPLASGTICQALDASLSVPPTSSKREKVGVGMGMCTDGGCPDAGLAERVCYAFIKPRWDPTGGVISFPYQRDKISAWVGGAGRGWIGGGDGSVLWAWRDNLGGGGGGLCVFIAFGELEYGEESMGF